MREDSGRPPGPCLISGATGTLGGQLVRELLAGGPDEVFVMVRAKNGYSATERFEQLRRTLGESDRLRLVEASEGSLADLPHSLTSIIHSSALVNFAVEDGVLQSNVATTWHLLCAAARLPRLDRFIHVSSLSVRTDSEASFSEADLDTGQRFVSPYTLTKFLAEVMIRKLHHDIPATVVRLGTVLPSIRGLGDGTSDWFRTTLKLWVQGRLTSVPMSFDQPIYPVTADAAAKVLVDLLRVPDVPPVLHLPAQSGPSAGYVFESLARELGVMEPRLLGQHTEEWRRYRATLAPLVAPIVDGLYPPPPPNGRLALVDSDESLRWFADHGLTSPSVPDGYWRHLAASVKPPVKSRHIVARPKAEIA